MANPASVFACALIAAAMHSAAAADAPLSADARIAVQTVQRSRDNASLPFIVIDKRRATLWLFDAQGRPLGATPVLLGAARGDATVPGIGDRPLAQVLPHERTTPAGRFVAEFGRNSANEDILWVDYDAAVSLHRVRTANAAEKRLARLASPSVADNRISYGCINVPAAFYDRTLLPQLGGVAPVVYILPETRAVSSLFARR
jgi:hypothetical protein